MDEADAESTSVAEVTARARAVAPVSCRASGRCWVRGARGAGRTQVQEDALAQRHAQRQRVLVGQQQLAQRGERNARTAVAAIVAAPPRTRERRGGSRSAARITHAASSAKGVKAESSGGSCTATGPGPTRSKSSVRKTTVIPFAP